jgi:hypothetical protein
MNDVTKVAPSTTKLQLASLTGHSSTTLFNNIRVTSNEEQDEVDAFLTKRCNTLMDIGFVTDMTPQSRAEAVNEYRRALRHYPKWVLAKAIDRAVAKSAGRPAPGQINAFAENITADVAREAKRAQRDEQERAEYEAKQVRTPLTTDCKFEADLEIERAGFTAARAKTLRARPLITSFAEADEVVNKPRRPHWTESEAQDSSRMKALQAARADNKLINEARQSSNRADWAAE